MKKFKDFSLRFAYFFVLQSILLGIFMWIYDRPKERSALYLSTHIKHDRLRDAPSPRIIFVGGSNLLFGLDSELFEEKTNYHPVNLGLIGGLRLNFMLSEALENAETGDLIILALEYHQLNVAADQANLPVLMGVIEQRPKNAKYLTLGHWRLLFDKGLLEQLGIKLRYSFSQAGLKSPFQSLEEKFDIVEEKPNKSDFNKYGDLIIYRDQPPPFNEANNHDVLPDQQNLDYKVIHANIERLNRFYSIFQSRNVDVIYSYPPISETSFSKKQAVAEELHTILSENLRIPIVNTPQSMVLPDENFIGESYHLFGQGIDQRTTRLINDLYQAGYLRQD